MPVDLQIWLFWGFFFAFAIKVPMFPFHTWLPDAHTEAPTAGSVILAGILLKMGLYGLVRFSIPLLPEGASAPSTVQVIAALSIIAIIYGALVSLMQKDWKRLVAYSSVSHLGFCTLGLIALNPNGIAGAMLQGINHGISTPLLFLVVGIAYERRHSRMISEYGGLSNRMPVYTVLFARRRQHRYGDREPCQGVQQARKRHHSHSPTFLFKTILLYVRHSESHYLRAAQHPA